jgi:phosphoribosylamine---glycine ligase
MNVLLLGSGGREHAIAIALALVAGIVDDLTAAGIRAFGPSKAAARLEGSKSFTKEFCARHAIPTAAYACFTDAASATAYVRAKGPPIVIKADGLAAGKGVTVAMSLAEAEAAIETIFSSGLGGAGIVVEECLEGEEVSFFALCDGTHAVSFESAQDHKRVGEGESGPNTGGMGAYSPAPIMDAQMSERVMLEIVAPTLKGMAAAGAPFKGVLFAGLMLCADGPKLIEYNVRFGDPETQAIMPRLEEDLLALMLACVDGRLPEKQARFSPSCSLRRAIRAPRCAEVKFLGSNRPRPCHSLRSPMPGRNVKGKKSSLMAAASSMSRRSVPMSRRHAPEPMWQSL